MFEKYRGEGIERVSLTIVFSAERCVAGAESLEKLRDAFLRSGADKPTNGRTNAENGVIRPLPSPATIITDDTPTTTALVAPRDSKHTRAMPLMLHHRTRCACACFRLLRCLSSTADGFTEDMHLIYGRTHFSKECVNLPELLFSRQQQQFTAMHALHREVGKTVVTARLDWVRNPPAPGRSINVRPNA